MRLAMFFAAFLLALGIFCVAAVSATQNGDLQKDLEKLEDLATKGLPNRAHRWSCDAAATFSCTVKGCEDVRVTVWVNLNFVDNQYQRCDSKGCDTYELTYSVAGIYTTVSPVGKDVFLKVLNDGSEFMEIASLGTAAFTSFGRCTPQN